MTGVGLSRLHRTAGVEASTAASLWGLELSAPKAHKVCMSAPKFANGQMVRFIPSSVQDSMGGIGVYEILRQMPIEDATEASYKIKNRSSGQERIAREHQLDTAL